MKLDIVEAAELRQWALGKGRGHFRRTCPACSRTRKTGSKLECLSVEITADMVVYHCWHCPVEGGVPLEAPEYQKPFEPEKKVKTKPTAMRWLKDGLDPLARTFLKSRGISEDTALLFNLGHALAYFPDLQREDHGIAFPYYVDGKLHGHKVRATSDKAHVCKPALYSLFGIQNVDMTESSDFIIAEGEIDALSFYEAGLPNATSVPNGASSFSRTEREDDKKAAYGFLWSSKKELDKAKRVLIATDADDPGEKLADELARRIGKHRCWRVKYPEGCKDANETLLKHGKEAVKLAVTAAEPWPIEGIYDAERFFPDVMDLYENGFGERILTGLNDVDELYSVGKGLLTVVTGIPGNGKSTFVDQLMINLARRYNYQMGICSFENPPSVHIAKLAEMLLQKHFFDDGMPGERMTRKEMEAVLPFISRHFKFLQQEDGSKATLDSIIERIKTAVFRWGVNCIVIDPYNYIERPKSAENETQWIDDMLTRLRMLAVAHDLHIWFVAHPTKLTMDAEGNYPPPKGYSISGSSAWYSKADFGLTVHRVPDEPGLVRIINWKTRFDWLGKEGEAKLLYDKTRNIYMHNNETDYLAYGQEQDGL